jgi:hypothetical protein
MTESTREYIPNTTSIYNLRSAIKCAAESDWLMFASVTPIYTHTAHTHIDNRLNYYLEPIILLTTNPGYKAFAMKLPWTLANTDNIIK